MCELVPIEHLSSHHAVLFYLLNDKIQFNEPNSSGVDESGGGESLEKKYFAVYNRLLLADILECIRPVGKLRTGLLDLLSRVPAISLAKSIEVFDKVLRRSMSILIREAHVNTLVEFIDQVRKKKADCRDLLLTSNKYYCVILFK